MSTGTGKATLTVALVVDESDANVLFWEVLLGEHGFEKVLKAKTGDEALTVFADFEKQKTSKEQIDLIVTAWELPGMAGTTFMQKMRSSRKRKYLPCIIYSKNMSPEDTQLTQDLGLKDIVKVPFNKGEVKDFLSKLIARESNLSKTEILLRKVEQYVFENKPNEAFKLLTKDLFAPGEHLKRTKLLQGEVNLLIGQKEEALKNFEESLKLDQDYLPAKYAISRTYSLLGKHDEAITMLSKISFLSPKNTGSLVNLSTAYIQADKIEDAQKTLNTISSLDPDSSNDQTIKDQYGKIALKQGDLTQAAKLLSETQNGDEIARFYNSVGISYVAKEQFDKGIETYKSALSLLSTKAKLYLVTYNLALAFKKKGDLEQSFKAFCESYLLEPTFEKAYASLVKTSAEMKEKNLKMDASLVEKVKATRSKAAV